jgi:predicted ThiF/HesA family dinucleotide-utilizing enzyme
MLFGYKMLLPDVRLSTRKQPTGDVILPGCEELSTRKQPTGEVILPECQELSTRKQPTGEVILPGCYVPLFME